MYRRTLVTPGALAFYLAAAPARLGLAMTGLGLVFLVHDLTGSSLTATGKPACRRSRWACTAALSRRCPAGGPMLALVGPGLAIAPILTLSSVVTPAAAIAAAGCGAVVISRVR